MMSTTLSDSTRWAVNRSFEPSSGFHPDRHPRGYILQCDCKANHTSQDAASKEFSPVLCAMACHQRGACLVGCLAHACRCAVDRSTVNCGAYPAPLAGLGSPRAA